MTGSMQKPSVTARPRDRFVALCGRQFRDADPAYFPVAHHRGRKIVLCTESCRAAFLADPEVFYRAHRNSEKTKGTLGSA
jgi:hypothetical protein